MRIARKLTLRAMLAIAATALTAPSALAQTEPLAHNQTPLLIAQQEISGANDMVCPAVTPSPVPTPGPLVTGGGCRVHFSSDGSEVGFRSHLSAGGVEAFVAACNMEFDMRIDAAGEGYLSHQELTNGTSSTCEIKPCGQVTPPTSEGRAWSFYLREREPAPRETLIMLFCFEPENGGAPSHCEVTLIWEVFSVTTAHRYRFGGGDVSGHGAAFPHCEIFGQLNSETALETTGELQAEQRLEVRHN